MTLFTRVTHPDALVKEDEGLHRGCELLHGDGHVMDLAAGDPGDLADRLREVLRRTRDVVVPDKDAGRCVGSRREPAL